MAFDAQQIFPIDFNKSAAVGVNIPFTGPGEVITNVISGSVVLTPPLSPQTTPFSSNYTTAEAIKNNLINYFLTNPGERPLNPSFGGGLRNFIFEQISSGNLQGLKSKIQKDLERYFPLVNVLNLNVKGQEDSNTINVNLSYSVNNTNISDNLTLNFI